LALLFSVDEYNGYQMVSGDNFRAHLSFCTKTALRYSQKRGKYVFWARTVCTISDAVVWILFLHWLCRISFLIADSL